MHPFHPLHDQELELLGYGHNWGDQRVFYRERGTRRVRSLPASQAAAAFGLSRPSFYSARSLFERGGLPALVAQSPGPRRAHKLSTEVVVFLERALAEDPSLRAPQLAQRLQEHFSLVVHPRSVERALARHRKRGLQTQTARASQPAPKR